MNFDINKSYVIIANSEYEGLLLKFRNSNPLVNFKFISANKFKKMFSYTYNDDIFFKYFGGNKTGNAKLNQYNYFSSYLRYLYFYNEIDNCDFSSFLNTKKDLFNKKLIHLNNEDGLYEQLLKNKEILLLNLEYDEELKTILLDIGAQFNYINTKYLGFAANFEKEVVEFRSVFEQFDYIFNSICDDIKSGISEKNIIIHANYEKYQFYFEYFSKTYNIPLIYEKRLRLIDELNVRSILNKCYIEKNIESFFKSDFVLKNEKISTFLHEIFLKCSDFDLLYKNIVQYLSSNISINKIGDRGILVTQEKSFDDKKHYIVDFYQGVYPRDYQDNDFILDEIKKCLHINQSYMKYKIDESICIDYITLNKTIITYSLNNIDSNYISSLANELNFKISAYKRNTNVDNSIKNSILKYQLYRDDFEKFSRVNEYLSKYENLYKNKIEYFDYKFKPFKSVPRLKEREYSQTTLEKYASCPFKYYIEEILNLNVYQTSFPAEIGKLCHGVLEKVYDENFDFNKVFNNELSKFKFKNDRERLIIPKIKIMLQNAVDFIIEHSTKIRYLYGNKNFSIRKEMNLQTKIDNHKIIGRLDSLILSEENNKSYYSIIDYKTGSFSFNINKLKDNESLQLPLYILLSKNDDDLSKFKFGGAYIQSILNENVYLKKDLSYEETIDIDKNILKSYKYNGIFNDDEDYYQSISSCKNIDSQNPYIKPIKKPDKNHQNDIDLSHGINNDVYDYILKTCQDVVLNLITSIENFKFDIQPKNEGDSYSSSCNNCSYKSICYICAKKEINYLLFNNELDEDDEEADNDGDV